MSDERPRRSIGFAVAVALLFATYLLIAFHFVEVGRVNQDEGWYLYAARMVYEGMLPYRDFAFFQAPLVPFIYGVPQHLFGAGLAVGRLTSFAVGASTVALGARLSFERGGRFAALLFLALVPFTPLLLWSWTTTRTEPLNALLLMLSAYLLFRRGAGVRSASGALAAATLAVATRIASLPVAAGVAVFALWRHRGSGREQAAVLLPAAAIALAGIALVLAAGPRVVTFDLVTRQVERHAQLDASTEPWSLGQIATMRMKDASLLRGSYGGVPLVAFGCAFAMLAVWRVRRERDEFTGYAAGLSLFALAAYLPNFAPRIVFPEYFASVFPLFLALAASCAGHLYARVAREGRAAVVAASAVLVVFQIACLGGQRDRLESADPTDLREVREVGEYLAGRVPATRTLVTTDTYLAVESGLRVPEGWEMGIFARFPNLSEADGRRLKVLAQGRVAASLRDPNVGAVALSDYSLGLLANASTEGLRPGRRLREAQLYKALPALSRFRLDRVVEDFGQFEDRLYILLPR